jgi:flagellar motor switch protein FliM
MKWLDRLKDRLKEIPVTITGELGKVKLDVSRVVDLKVDNLIMLDRRVDEDIDILVEGSRKFTGKFGIYRGAMAVKVNKVL